MRVGHVIEFSPAGEATAMHNDKFDLSFLGPQSIVRATEIKFNEKEQKWEIQVASKQMNGDGSSSPVKWQTVSRGSGFATYEGARQVEVSWLNLCRLEGAHPLSHTGLEILRQTREDMKL